MQRGENIRKLIGDILNTVADSDVSPFDSLFALATVMKELADILNIPSEQLLLAIRHTLEQSLEGEIH